jgi:hypothetical protein
MERSKATARVIPGIRGSVLHQTCVEIYRRHAAEADVACPACQQPTPCPSRTFAARVIETAGDNTRRYDLGSPGRSSDRDEPVDGSAVRMLPGGVVGYALGGAGRVRAPYHAWDR